MKRFLDRIDGALASVETVIIAAFSLAALALGTAQVVMRYVLNIGFHWTEAIFVILTVAAMLFGGSRAVRDDAHVKVDLLPQLLPQAAQRPLRVFRYAVSLGLVAVFFYAGLQYVLFTKAMGIVSPSSGLPDWIIYAIVPVTMGSFALRYLVLLARESRGEDTGHSEAEEAVDAARHGGSGT